jgi:hypothetical protein
MDGKARLTMNRSRLDMNTASDKTPTTAVTRRASGAAAFTGAAVAAAAFTEAAFTGAGCAGGVELTEHPPM